MTYAEEYEAKKFAAMKHMEKLLGRDLTVSEASILLYGYASGYLDMQKRYAEEREKAWREAKEKP